MAPSFMHRTAADTSACALMITAVLSSPCAQLLQQRDPAHAGQRQVEHQAPMRRGGHPRHPGTVFLPTRVSRTFDFAYDPQANNRVGRITVTLAGEPPFTVDLTPEQHRAGAAFDRFGLMSFRRGGKYSILYFDDRTYTTRRPDHPPVRHEQKIVKFPYPAGGRKY